MTVNCGVPMVSTPIPLSCSHSSHAFTRRVSNLVGYNVSKSRNNRRFKSGLCTDVHDLISTAPREPQERIWSLRATASDESIPTESSESTETRPGGKLRLEDIPKRTLHLLTVKGHKLKAEVVIGKKGLDTGVFNSILQNFNRREVVRVKVSKACKIPAADIAKDLEQRSGYLIIFQAGAKMILYRGDLADEILAKDTEQNE